VAVPVLATLAFAYRPLLFASVDPEGAEARGVSLRLISVLLLLLLAVTTAEAIQVVGVLLVLTLVITPAAAATQLTARPMLGLVLSVVIAFAATEGGILLSLVQPWPTSFFISALSFAAYVAARILGRTRRATQRTPMAAVGSRAGRRADDVVAPIAGARGGAATGRRIDREGGRP
jgi:zinc/manganese transport system permease protein